MRKITVITHGYDFSDEYSLISYLDALLIDNRHALTVMDYHYPFLHIIPVRKTNHDDYYQVDGQYKHGFGFDTWDDAILDKIASMSALEFLSFIASQKYWKDR